MIRANVVAALRRLTALSALTLLAILACAASLAAQNAPLPPGTVGTVTPQTCPGAFWSPGSANPPTCFSTSLICTNQATTPNLGLVYSYVIPPSQTLFGTVVLFGGGQGELADAQVLDRFARDYYNLGYEVVQIAWNSDWEQTTDPLGILTAACRPAGFLNYVLNTPLLNARSANPRAGFCAHGFSAGSGALGYSLVWYGDSALPPNYLSTDLDNVELTSGPVFSDISLGCQVPPPPNVVNICPPGQYGCSSGTTQWTDNPAYIDEDLNWVQAWTGNLSPACNNKTQATGANNARWKAMSILTGTGGNFTYPNLGMAGWLCASSLPSTCTYECPNNSAAQGELFFSQFTSNTQVAGYKLTGIIDCNNAEGVADGYDPDGGCIPPPGGGCTTGESAIVAHMQAQCKHPTPH